MLIDRIERLPNLAELAWEGASPHLDHEAAVARLEAEFKATGTPYRVVTVFRSRGPCHTGEHQVGRVEQRLVDPRRPAADGGAAEITLTVWNGQLHDATEHGVALPADVIEFMGKVELD